MGITQNLKQLLISLSLTHQIRLQKGLRQQLVVLLVTIRLVVLPTAGQIAAPAETVSVNALVKGIGQIVRVVLKDNEGSAEATKTSGEKNKVVGKLLGEKTNGGDQAQAAAASASIGAVTGSDILKAIAKSGEAKGEPTIEQSKNAAEIAIAKKEDNKDLNVVKKDAVIAAGIALRAMAKDGQLAAKN